MIHGILKDWSFECEILVIYAPNDKEGRRLLWEELISTRTNSSHPLLVMGDFNEVRSIEERSGGSSCLASIEEFRSWSNEMMIEDLPLIGRKFTWARSNSRSRLDRMFFDVEWATKFPDASLHALPNSISDHTPLSLSLIKTTTEFRPFRSINAWFSHPGFIKFVREEWKNLRDLPVTRKLKALQLPIRKWNKECFGNIDSTIRRLEEDQVRTQNKIDCGIGDECDIARITAIDAQLNKWMDRKASYWKQLAKDKWIKEGDRNTKYFHAVALGKRRYKRIEQIRHGNRIFKKPRAIKMELLKFYKELYKQRSAPRIHLVEGLLPKITREQADSLEKRPTMDEINKALDDCDGSKAPGYDGFNFKFIKEMWQDFGGEVSSFIMEFFDTGKLPNEINHTWVTLIPKVDGAIDIKDFRPISMIGSIYKIIAKILAKRIANVLPELISETQSAFVKNRQILDGALIANEVVWWLKKTRQKAAILKLDFQKAYDTVRWDFLEETLVGMGFGRKWIVWIMECVRTASMSILVNGSPTSSFHLQRGLRQGDPLSPFLFLLVAETFSRLVCRGKDLGILKGVDVGIEHIPITHLQFADDTIIFTPADFSTLENYKKLLKCFELLSGLRINYGKSVIIPINCEDEWIEGARNRLECEVAKLPVTYLGIPLGANPRRMETWKPIIDKVEKRLAIWKARTLSKAGRLVLIKSVLNNLPTYYLSLFRMPKKVARRLIQLERNFFWGKTNKGNACSSLVAWNLIQKPMDQGGLGVGDLYVKNAALLYKWRWRFAENHRPLWKEIVRSNHNVNYYEDLHRLGRKAQTSLWGQIINFESFNTGVREVASKGIRMRVGNGAQTRFWHDFWTGEESLKNLFPRLFLLSIQKDKLIVEMGEWENGTWSWEFRWRRKLFAWEDELVGDLYLAVNRTMLRANTRDERVWVFDKSNRFSVSNFVLQVARNLNSDDTAGRNGCLAWRKVAPPRAQLHVWFVMQGRLMTKDRLLRFGSSEIEDDRCTFCKEEPETLEHIFFSCRVSSSLWYYCCNRWNLSFCLPKEPVACFLSWLGTPFRKFDRKLWISLFYVISWSIWFIRNKMIFQGFEPIWDFEKKMLILRLHSWIRSWCPRFALSLTSSTEDLINIRGWNGD